MKRDVGLGPKGIASYSKLTFDLEFCLNLALNSNFLPRYKLTLCVNARI